ncbi:uncharacterized protein FOMMEDRAFT_26103 [Fomitiporia mediterranea MF3/22]|uniref:uncharacterized protein n=1 Tax=Fomitiporia mediterranea (strain MF3/22) TaxID=694068 RepID=UPI00044096D7|nr:uncharacterized protein FOMMEDRAFT_26103 [Fomitiporia mediterranea MF3/22]EJD06962.1 hypothetical protein FOMMEDRAFT_26103 [Fomitiporia mediterranea MF3/22]
MRETRTNALGWSQTGLLVKIISFFSSRQQDHSLIRDTASFYAFDQSIFTQEIFPRMLRFPDSHIPQVHANSSNAFRINELPTDILNEIFLRVVRIAQKDVASEESMLVPLRLSHVCRTWRHAVVSCASLWAYINVLVDVYRSTEQDERLVKAVDTCIEMSKAAPLSLSVTCNTIHVPKPKLEVARYILNRLLGQQHRWRVANFAFKEMDPIVSCASLWAYINVLVDVYRSTEQDERLVKAVDTCIEMSKAAPLSLSVTCNTIHVPKPKLEVARYILNRLLGQQHRWRVANFAFKEMDPSRLPEIELINVPMLESLRISWRTLGASNMAQPQVRIDASRSLSLRSLHVKGIRLEISGGKLYGVKELTFHGVETEVRLVEHLEIVKKAPLLEFMEVEFVSSKLAGPDDFQLPVITLHNLHTLVVNGSNVSMSIIRNLILPSLRRLICGPFGPANYQNIKGLVDMGERNQPPLEYLEVCNTSVTEWTEDKVVALLRLLPELKTLRMEKVYVTSNLFNMLSVKDTAKSHNEFWGVVPILCPNLMEFYLKRNGYLCDGEEKQKECVDSLHPSNLSIYYAVTNTTAAYAGPVLCI